MIRKLAKMFMALVLLAALCPPAWAATDYSSMTTEELSKLRGTMRNASQEERNAFREEWQKRMHEMTQEERDRYLGRPAPASSEGTGMGQGRGRGQGGGGQGMGRGMGQGRGRW